MKKVGKITIAILRLIVSLLGVAAGVIATILYLSIQWMFATWNNLTMDELVFHLTAPLDGTNEDMIKEYLNVCIAPAVLVLITIIVLLIVYRKNKVYWFVIIGILLGSIIWANVSAADAWKRLDIGGYAKNKGTYSTFIDDYYVDPAEVEITFPEQKRNLIYIFLESMETTYADQENGGAFDQDVMFELTELAQEYEDFSGESTALNGGYAMPGTTWTMGAMFAHTSGLPLNISISNNYMDTQDSFFSGAVTLGDILENEGYSQTLLIGSDASFGGRELYFTEHGDYDMVDYNYAIDNGMIPKDYHVFWGYEDQKLFGFAKEKLLELAKQDNPFNLTMLTVDTHFEDGYVCEQCPDIYGDQYSNVMACSSRQVKEFVEWIQEQEFYENTTIVLVGDHPTMDSDFCKDIDDDYIRRVYTSYINTAVETRSGLTREYTTFDIFPTTLASLGGVIEGERLGLGTNLYSETQTLTERLDRDLMEKEIGKKSKLMETLADIDENEEEVLKRDGKLPMANISVGEYQYRSGVLPVSVTDISNISEGIEKVQIAVWTAKDQSDLQWLEMAENEEDSYFANINVPNFGYMTGEYQIHAYVIDKNGDQYEVGTAIGYVE